MKSFIVPIIKDKKGDSSNRDNYRGIAISCINSKVLEDILIHKAGLCLRSDERQFGFKSHHSCGDCSFLLKESVKYFLDKGNRKMFGCSLDLSKAYDRESHYRLFTRLLDAGCPAYFVKFLRHWYESESMVVKWNGKQSSPFGVHNGVRQRSVLSPICLIHTLTISYDS